MVKKSTTSKDSAVRKRGARHRARRRAVEILFEAEAKGVSPLDLIDQRRELAITDDTVALVGEYTEVLLRGVSADREQIDAVLTSYLEKWTLPRLPAVDRTILRLATWELFNAVDVDPVTIVDQAVELAKELSTDESPAFVNGVIGKIVTLAPHVRAAAAATPRRKPEGGGTDSLG